LNVSHPPDAAPFYVSQAKIQFVLGAFPPPPAAGTGLSLQFLGFACGKASGISALSLALPNTLRVFGLGVLLRKTP
jgi:hypothetical protein